MDWDKLAQGAMSTFTKACEITKEKREQFEKKFVIELRKMSDDQIRNGLRNIGRDDWRYEFVEDEAYRRNII